MIRCDLLGTIVAGLTVALAADLPLPAATETPSTGVASRIAVRFDQQSGLWRVEGQRHTIQLNPTNLSLRVSAGPVRWQMRSSAPGDLQVRHAGRTAQLELAAAGQKTIAPYRTGFQSGLKLGLSGFRDGSETLDLALQLFLCLEGADEDLVATAIASDGATRVVQCDWPPGLASESFDTTVVPFMQGMLLPKQWPEKTWLYDTLSFGRGLYQPWWGHQQNGAAMLVILETPDDGGCHFDHPAGGPTHIGPHWVNALGRWAYPRRARFCFLDSGNYVDLAKRYRRQAMASGRFVSLREKIARTPRVARLLGAPVVHTSILYHIQPESSYYQEGQAGAQPSTRRVRRAGQTTRSPRRAGHHERLRAPGWLGLSRLRQPAPGRPATVSGGGRVGRHEAIRRRVRPVGFPVRNP